MLADPMREVEVVDGLDELLDGGRRLRARDPERFLRVLALIRAYLAIYDKREEPAATKIGRMLRARGVKADA